MKKIYIECNMGVAGDMLCGALLDTLDSDKRNKAVNKLNSLFSHIDISCKSESKCGICGTKFNVQIEEEHHSHNSLSEIYGIIDSLDISDNVKENAKLKNVGDPEGSHTPTSPNVTRNTIIAFLGGLILALIISFVRDFLDVKIKYNEEMTTILDLPILAAIPDFEYFSNQKNANKYGNRYGK